MTGSTITFEDAPYPKPAADVPNQHEYKFPSWKSVRFRGFMGGIISMLDQLSPFWQGVAGSSC